MEVRKLKKKKKMFGKLLLFTHLHFNPVIKLLQKIKMAHLSLTTPNISSIGEVCDSVRMDLLSSSGGDHWATGGLRVNSTSVKGGLIRFPLFMLDGNAILPMTPKAGCALQTSTIFLNWSQDLHGEMYLDLGKVPPS